MRAWFPWCYELQVVGMGTPVLRLARLPAAGAVGEQEAWLMEALAVMASEQQTFNDRDRKAHG